MTTSDDIAVEPVVSAHPPCTLALNIACKRLLCSAQDPRHRYCCASHTPTSVVVFKNTGVGGGGLMPKQLCAQARSPRMRRASWMSLGMMVTRLAWMAARLVSSNRPTR